MHQPRNTMRLCVLAVAIALVATGCDWVTWGFGPGRLGNNVTEDTLGPSNVGQLHEIWSTSLGAVIDTSPVVANQINVGGTPTNLAYVGTEHSLFAAVNTSNGQIVWQRQFASQTTSCGESPDGIFGITSAAAIDRDRNLVYVAPADGKVHALNLATGVEASGWPVAITANPSHEFVLGALNLWQGRLYVPTASHCDDLPYEGKVESIDTSNATVSHVFYVTPQGGGRGGSVWGWGGVSIDTNDSNVYAATGNAAIGQGETYGYSDRVVRLTPDLQPVASNAPSVDVFDDDFGSTPVLIQRDGCPPEFAVERKDGRLFLYNRDAINFGSVQTIPISGSPYEFIGLPAWDSATKTLYVANPAVATLFYHGMVAFTLGTDCQLHLRWQTQAGVDGSVVSTPTVANGVVYYGDGGNRQVHAFNAQTGSLLWSSSTVTGQVYAAPIVIAGTLLAGAWDGKLHAWRAD